MLGRVPSRALPALAAVLFQSKERKKAAGGRRSLTWKWETHPYYNLSVKILRARNIKTTDLLSKADCYVALRLPTASPLTSRTKVIYNCSDPEWNETFHYRIHGALKNVVELTLCDEDVVLNDNLSSIVFDVGRIKPGRCLKRVFPLNPETNEELEVEFKVEECSDPPTEVITNGVLVAHRSLCLEGTIDRGDQPRQREEGEKQFKLSVAGAYEKETCIPYRPDPDQDRQTPFVFHADRELCPQLEVQLQQTLTILQEGLGPGGEQQTTVLGMGCLPISSLPLSKKVDLTVPLGKEQSVDLKLKTEESHQDLDVRLGFDLSNGEKEYLDKRKQIASQALKEALNLKEVPCKDEVPIVAIVGSGGGTRAMTSLSGNLSGLQLLNLLDCVTYVSGVSGSTWCMTSLYKDPDWSHKDLQVPINSIRNSVTLSKSGAFSPDRIKYYFRELASLEKDGRKVSFTDLWGLILEYFFYQKENPSKLSDQQESVRWAQNPYPIYGGVNVRINVSGSDFAEWCEFTPHEVGFRKYGAFVRTEDFGSEFFMGHLIRRRQEPRICYLEGMWGSAFAASLDEIWAEVAGTGFAWIDSLKDVIKVVDDSRKLHLRDPLQFKTRLVMPGGILSQIFQDIFKSRFTAGESYNFTRGLYLHRDYVDITEFVAWNGHHLDAFPNQLTPMEENLYLVDGGFSINSPFPLVLQPERDVDVILSFNYSWEAPFEVLELTTRYCKERGIPFPKIILTNEDQKKPKECYMFVDAENPKAPIVLHFPLVNDTFQKHKSPGVELQTEEEKSFRNFVIAGRDSPYRTRNFTYEPYHFDRLVEVSRYNVLNNKETILNALNLALTRRKLKQKNIN
ncbi:cytosolic phospholipase A2 zeta [Rhinatrema bivittatum]|uniref:cytosolic phospholipase A2 zeta n=1 Tax=Rhinatrema bivittatum TaxID=194408 RepID=UPI00112C3115|nr:cytosolic phospholipase A2 zeta [Rhinatrema bivittatum]